MAVRRVPQHFQRQKQDGEGSSAEASSEGGEDEEKRCVKNPRIAHQEIKPKEWKIGIRADLRMNLNMLRSLNLIVKAVVMV